MIYTAVIYKPSGLYMQGKTTNKRTHFCNLADAAPRLFLSEVDANRAIRGFCFQHELNPEDFITTKMELHNVDA